MKFTVNGHERSADAPEGAALLYVLRNDLSLMAPKYGCGNGQCGACTVLVDGQPMRTCVVPVSAVQDRAIVTLDGLSEDATIRKLQEAFIAEQAVQCGYCSNGMIMGAKVLLDSNPAPSRKEICQALDPYLCRCGAHVRIIRAVQRAAGMTSR